MNFSVQEMINFCVVSFRNFNIKQGNYTHLKLSLSIFVKVLSLKV
jgi:hypothetical protein